MLYECYATVLIEFESDKELTNEEVEYVAKERFFQVADTVTADKVTIEWDTYE